VGDIGAEFRGYTDCDQRAKGRFGIAWCEMMYRNESEYDHLKICLFWTGVLFMASDGVWRIDMNFHIITQVSVSLSVLSPRKADSSRND
jgi:hypothetical protein